MPPLTIRIRLLSIVMNIITCRTVLAVLSIIPDTWHFFYCAFERSAVRTFVQRSVRTFVQCSVRTFVQCSVRTFVQRSVHTFVQRSVRSFSVQFVHSYVQRSVRTFVQRLVRTFSSYIRSAFIRTVRTFVQRSFVHCEFQFQLKFAMYEKVERANSSLRNVYRSTMGEDRFNSLMLLYAHKDIELNIDAIIDSYI